MSVNASRGVDVSKSNIERLKVNLSKKVRAWLEVRKRAARKIDIRAAELDWAYRHALDPYELDPTLPIEPGLITREFFVRNPRSKIWVWSGDLPRAKRRKLRMRR